MCHALLVHQCMPVPIQHGVIFCNSKIKAKFDCGYICNSCIPVCLALFQQSFHLCSLFSFVCMPHLQQIKTVRHTTKIMSTWRGTRGLLQWPQVQPWHLTNKPHRLVELISTSQTSQGCVSCLASGDGVPSFQLTVPGIP
jgi:hypothetical protein